MSHIVQLIQGSEAWHLHRSLYRNASETSAVMGLSPWLSPYQLWEIKTGRRSHEVTFPMQRGIELEPKARQAYEESTGHIMEPVVMVNGDYSASLDGMSLSGNLILEVKCPMKGQESETWRLAVAGLVERHYALQIQHQLMVTGAKLCHFYVFDGREGVMVEVLPNKDDMALIKAAWDAFMVFVVSDTPPPLTPLDTVIREDDVWRSAAENFITSKQALEGAMARAEEAKAQLASLAQHSSERGYGVSVSKFWRGKTNPKPEVRVSIVRQEAQPC